MIAIVSILAGLGLFFFGLETLSDNLKRLAGRRLRATVTRFARNRWLGFLSGTLAGAFTPAGTVLTFVMVSLLRSGGITVPSALPVFIGSNVGNSAIVMIAAIEIETWVLLVMGAAGVLRLVERLAAWRPVLNAFFGLALLYFGLMLIKAGAGAAGESDLARDLLERAAGYYSVGLLAGIALRFVAQSSSAVSLLALALAGGGVFGLEQAVMMIYGSNIGASFSTLAMTAGLRGRERQLAYYQALIGFVGGAILVPLFYLEVLAGLPGVIAFLRWIGGSLEMQVALAFLIFNLVPGIVLLALVEPTARALERISPPTRVEEDGKPAFIYDQALDEAETALDLVALEQARLMRLHQRYCSVARDLLPSRERALAYRHLVAATSQLAASLQEFLDELGHTTMSSASFERLHTAIEAQGLITALGSTQAELTATIHAIDHSSPLREFADIVTEAIEAILVTLDETLEQGDLDNLVFLRAMTGDRRDVLQQIRGDYLSGARPLSPQDSLSLVNLTSLYQRAVWLLGRYLGVREREIEERASGATLAAPAAEAA